jgi:hypothetical protein
VARRELDWRRQGYFTSRAYAVLITGANPETLEAARRKLPGEIIVLRADARSLEDAAHVASEIEQRFSRLDVAFLNAGVGRKDAPLQRAANAAAPTRDAAGSSPQKIATERRPGEACSMGTTSTLKMSPNGSGRRRSRGAFLCEGSLGSFSMR